MEVTRELTNLETALASLLVVAKVCCNAQVPQVHTTIVVGLELYEEGSDIPVTSSVMLRSALDWVFMIGSWLFLLYGCPSCFIFPCMSNCWYRFQRLVKSEAVGATVCGDTDGQWRCANCLERWSWATGGAYRLLVIGDWNPIAQTFQSYVLAFVGQISDAQNNMINYLKGCKALETLNGHPITRENVLRMIHTLNVETDRRLTKGIKEVKVATAKDPREALEWASCRLFCEDERLSLPGPGRRFNAIATELYHEPVVAIDSNSLDALLYACASGLAVEQAPQGTKAEKDLKWRVTSSDGFRRGRELLSRL